MGPDVYSGPSSSDVLCLDQEQIGDCTRGLAKGLRCVLAPSLVKINLLTLSTHRCNWKCYQSLLAPSLEACYSLRLGIVCSALKTNV